MLFRSRLRAPRNYSKWSLDIPFSNFAVFLAELYIFCHRAYKEHSILKFGEFCLAIHPLLRGLISEHKVGYLDDVTLSGPRQIVVDHIKTIISKSEELGLELKAAK